MVALTPVTLLIKKENVYAMKQIKEWLCELIESEGEFYGYIKLTVCLRKKYNLYINKKKVYRLCKELDILRPQRQKKIKHPRKIARNRVITAPNQLWEIDVKYGYIAGEDRFFFIAPIIDVYDRSIVDCHIGLSCSALDIAVTVKGALFKRAIYDNEEKTLILRSDNGPQFISSLFEETCNNLKIEHERIPFKTPNKNAHIESFNNILEHECLACNEFETYAEGYKAVSEFIKFYNEVRIHSGINYLSPNEFYLKTLLNLIDPVEVRV